MMHSPTLDEASVRLNGDNFQRRAASDDRTVANLFRVVDFPEDGFPTNPIKGSRGIAR